LNHNLLFWGKGGEITSFTAWLFETQLSILGKRGTVSLLNHNLLFWEKDGLRGKIPSYFTIWLLSHNLLFLERKGKTPFASRFGS